MPKLIVLLVFVIVFAGGVLFYINTPDATDAIATPESESVMTEEEAEMTDDTKSPSVADPAAATETTPAVTTQTAGVTPTTQSPSSVETNPVGVDDALSDLDSLFDDGYDDSGLDATFEDNLDESYDI